MPDPNNPMPEDLVPGADAEQGSGTSIEEVEQRLRELADKATQTQDETIEVKPQILYGISIFFMSNGKPHVEVTGEPTALELQMLLSPALANVNANITAQTIIDMMMDMQKKKLAQNQIIRPGQ